MIFGYFRRRGFQIGGVGLLISGSVDGLCLCVWLCCGWVVAEMAGSSGFPMGFFFFSFCCDAGFFYFIFFNMGFCFGGILVSSGQWWLGFFWVFVPMGLCLCVCF